MWGKKLKRNTENDKKNPSVANLRKFQKIFSYESEGLTLDFKGDTLVCTECGRRVKGNSSRCRPALDLVQKDRRGRKTHGRTRAAIFAGSTLSLQ